MVRKRGSGAGGPAGAEAAHADAFAWFASNDSNVAACDRWDVKADRLAYAVLLLLAKGRGVTFSLSWEQTTVRIAVLDGDHRAVVSINDSMEFDDAVDSIIARAEVLEKAPRREWSDIERRYKK